MANKTIRMLQDATIDGVPYRGNEAVEIDEALAKQAVKGGVADDNEAAVKYVTGELKAKVKKHKADAKEVKEEKK